MRAMAESSNSDGAGSVWDEVDRRYDEPYSSKAVCGYLKQLDERLDSVIFRQVKALTVLEVATLRALGEDGLSEEDQLAAEQAIIHLNIFTHQLEVIESFIRRHLYQLTELPDPGTGSVEDDVINYYERRAEFARFNRGLAKPFLTRGFSQFEFKDWEAGHPREAIDHPI